MPNVIQPAEGLGGARFAIVVAEWNKSITSKLLEGALETFTSAGVADEQLDVAWTPGAWEVPVAVQRLADTCRYSALLALAAVIKGETSHDRYLNQGVTEGLMRIALEHSVPVLFGVLTCETMEQAIQRAGGNVGNKGTECAEAALKMVGLFQALPSN